jgi:CheY-like chemotaxis protein
MLNVLLVDDNADLRQNMAEILELEGFGVHEAGDGESALRQLLVAPPPPDLIVLDIRMPVMDGPTFLKVKELVPCIRQLPVIVVSAFCGEAHGLPGARTVLEKPVDITVLVAQIRECCARAA